MTILNLNQELAVLEVSGVEAQTYLQGQLTNDIRELAPKTFQYSAHLNHKGRILATFIITSPQENCYYLITNKAVAEKIIPRLKMFILRSKVTLSISPLNLSLSHQQVDNNLGLELSQDNYLTLSLETLSEHQDNNAWHNYLVAHNIPLIYSETMEKIIPQQINYDLLGGINFKKGCYTGQEIVARTHYLGKIKRRLVKFITDQVPQIGQSVVSPLLNNQEVGLIVDYYHDQARNEYHGLLSLQNDCLNAAFLDINNQHKLNCQAIIEE